MSVRCQILNKTTQKLVHDTVTLVKTETCMLKLFFEYSYVKMSRLNDKIRYSYLLLCRQSSCSSVLCVTGASTFDKFNILINTPLGALSGFQSANLFVVTAQFKKISPILETVYNVNV